MIETVKNALIYRRYDNYALLPYEYSLTINNKFEVDFSLNKTGPKINCVHTVLRRCFDIAFNEG